MKITPVGITSHVMYMSWVISVISQGGQIRDEHTCARLEGGCALGQMSEKKTIAEQRCVKETADTR